MLGLSERQYAARIGMSRGAVQKAKAAGRLVLHPDGSIDPQASHRKRAETTDPSKRRASGEPGAHRLKAVPEAAVSAVGDTLKEQGMATPAQQLAALPPMAVRAMKRTLNATAASDLHRALQ